MRTLVAELGLQDAHKTAMVPVESDSGIFQESQPNSSRVVQLSPTQPNSRKLNTCRSIP